MSSHFFYLIRALQERNPGQYDPDAPPFLEELKASTLDKPAGTLTLHFTDGTVEIYLLKYLEIKI